VLQGFTEFGLRSWKAVTLRLVGQGFLSGLSDLEAPIGLSRLRAALLLIWCGNPEAQCYWTKHKSGASGKEQEAPAAA